MPNWVLNLLQLHGAPGPLERFIEETAGEHEVLTFERHLPTPRDLLPPHTPSPPLTPGGDARWRDWRVQHWGTKWDAMFAVASLDVEHGIAEYRFHTAWSPPDAWLREVSRRHPEFTLLHEYVEEMQQFAGRARWIGGVRVQHEELDPQSLDWDEWEEDEAE